VSDERVRWWSSHTARSDTSRMVRTMKAVVETDAGTGESASALRVSSELRLCYVEKGSW